MLTFAIPNMTCGHCVRAITQAVHEADPAARVQVDLPTRRVDIDTKATRDSVLARLVEAGYTPD